jgi:hypothetical protein
MIVDQRILVDQEKIITVEQADVRRWTEIAQR